MDTGPICVDSCMGSDVGSHNCSASLINGGGEALIVARRVGGTFSSTLDHERVASARLDLPVTRFALHPLDAAAISVAGLGLSSDCVLPAWNGEFVCKPGRRIVGRLTLLDGE